MRRGYPAGNGGIGGWLVVLTVLGAAAAGGRPVNRVCKLLDSASFPGSALVVDREASNG